MQRQTKLATLAISMGGNIGIGTEDWPFIEDGVPAEDNAQLIARAVRIAKEMDREIADPSEARKMLNL